MKKKNKIKQMNNIIVYFITNILSIQWFKNILQ